MPRAEQQQLGAIIASLGDALKKSMIVPLVESYVANGAVAGQQSSHCIIHILPLEVDHFVIPDGRSALREQLETYFAPKRAAQTDALSQAIASNPELRKMIVEQPEELIANLPVAPDLAKLFAGVDVKKLSEKLREQDQPRATTLTDQALREFINSKEKLRELILNDPITLEHALSEQPRLAAFFLGTTVSAVRERYLRGASHV
jgi:hypothetical protein